MTVVLRATPRVCRHTWDALVCHNCDCRIEPGQEYFSRIQVSAEGAWHLHRTHRDCENLAVALVDRFYSSWSSVPNDQGYSPVHEFPVARIELFRGLYPHAVCRAIFQIDRAAELARKLANDEL